jgi:hypothetical protein
LTDFPQARVDLLLDKRTREGYTTTSQTSHRR